MYNTVDVVTVLSLFLGGLNRTSEEQFRADLDLLESELAGLEDGDLNLLHDRLLRIKHHIESIQIERAKVYNGYYDQLTHIDEEDDPILQLNPLLEDRKQSIKARQQICQKWIEKAESLISELDDI